MTTEGDDITFTQCAALEGSFRAAGGFLAGWKFNGLLFSTLISLSLLGLKKTPFVRCGKERGGMLPNDYNKSLLSFPVLGITAGWLMALHHLRLELIRLFFCQVDSLSLFQLYFLSPLQFFSVFRPLFAFLCAQRDMYRLGLLLELFWEPRCWICCW